MVTHTHQWSHIIKTVKYKFPSFRQIFYAFILSLWAIIYKFVICKASGTLETMIVVVYLHHHVIATVIWYILWHLQPLNGSLEVSLHICPKKLYFSSHVVAGQIFTELKLNKTMGRVEIMKNITCIWHFLENVQLKLYCGFFKKSNNARGFLSMGHEYHFD